MKEKDSEMETPEVFVKNRNYGCRVKKYVCDELEYVSLENDLVRVEFCTGKGADLTSFLYKPTDMDFFLHAPIDRKNAVQASTKASGGGAFLDCYGGGWQDLFPTYGGPADYYGAQIGIHGEACIYPWDTTVVEDTPDRISVTFSLYLKRSPFRLERNYVLERGSAKLTLTQSVENTGTQTYDFMWGHHPAFGFPFLDESVRIKLKGNPDLLVPAGAAGTDDCPFAEETKGVWPILKDRNGNDFLADRAYSAKDRMRAEYVISGMEEGDIEVVNENKKIGFRMKYDSNIFRHIWVWGLYCGSKGYPWFGRVYTLGVEPQSSSPANFELAKAAGDVLCIEPGKKMTTVFTSEVTKY